MTQALLHRGRDVNPPTPSFGVRYAALVYAEVLGYQALRFIRLTSPYYLGHVGRRYLGVPVLFTYGAASFTAHVLSVVFGSSNKQVIGPNTGWIVAMMQAIQAFRYGSISKFIGDTMRESDGSFASVAGVDAPVAMLACTGCPNPTPVCFIDFGP